MVLITGATSIVGMAMAKAFIDAQKDLLLVAQNEHELEFVIDKLGPSTGTIEHYVCDLSNQEEVNTFALYVKESKKPIDTLINNTGMSQVGFFLDYNENDWINLFQLHVFSTFSITKAVIPAMMMQGKGKIINISSMTGGIGATSESIYAASKGAINAFTQALARELADSHIVVNGIACGRSDNRSRELFNSRNHEPLHHVYPPGKISCAQEVADLALFLASPQSNYLTGQVLPLHNCFI